MKSVEKVKKRWELWFGEYSDIYRDDPLIKLLTDEFEENKDKIFQDISDKYDELDSSEKRNLILSIKIEEDEIEKYLGDFDIFKEILRKESSKKFFTRKYDGKELESKGTGICFSCNNKTQVYGFASPFSIFTVDKKGFAPQFSQKDSWKQLPICERCSIFLVAGKEFLDKYLSKRFYEYRCYIIPSFMYGNIEEEVIEDIKDAESKKSIKSLLSLEDDDILDIIKDKNDLMSLIFVFYRPKGGDSFDIVNYIEDVPPSWIRSLFDKFSEVGEKNTFKEEYLKKIFGKKWSDDFIEGRINGNDIWRYKIDFSSIIRDFFPDSPKETGVYNKYFIDIIGDILAKRTINPNFLIHSFIREIRNKHTNNLGDAEKLYALKSLYLFSFIGTLDLIEGLEMNEKYESYETGLEKLEEFFGDFEHAFNTPDKKAAFLEGVLVKFLLTVQFAREETTPFRSRLYGLKLDKNRIRKLLPEIIGKLREYKVGYSWLEELTSKYLLEAENTGWKLSKDEISYYFALGLNLGGIFREKKENKGEGDKNE